MLFTPGILPLKLITKGNFILVHHEITSDEGICDLSTDLHVWVW